MPENKKSITVDCIVKSTPEEVWEYWTKPEHIVNWNFASEDWCCPKAENDLRVGGKFVSRMEARNKSQGFDFNGVYTEISLHKKISYDIDPEYFKKQNLAGRKVTIEFEKQGNKTRIVENFDMEETHSEEQQREGWQSILNNFKKYVENQKKQKIVPFLWFDNQARDAAKFYLSIFKNSKLKSDTSLDDTPSGKVDILSIELEGQEFNLMSAGPYTKINPSISFMVNFDPSQNKEATKEIEEVWKKLIDGGKALMEIGEYSWSKRYGWVQDKFGVSWQLILTNPQGEERPLILPSLLFTGDKYGKAEEALNFYLSVFTSRRGSTNGGKNSKRGTLLHYGPNQAPNKEGTVMFSDFMLENEWFTAMDGAGQHNFAFNEAVSFVIDCIDQKETDYFWESLSKDGKEGQCGWLKDKFGVSWQVVPRQLNELMSKDKTGKVMQAMLKMNKIIVKDLENAGKI